MPGRIEVMRTAQTSGELEVLDFEGSRESAACEVPNRVNTAR